MAELRSCHNCGNNTNGHGNCVETFRMPEDPKDHCANWTERKKRTNFDRIRDMPDYELIDLLRCECCIHETERCGMDKCTDGKLAWLHKEVD